MAPTVTLHAVMSFAASLEMGEWRDRIIGHLERQDFTRALVVCGEAVLTLLRRETDLSVDELRIRMRDCRNLEKLEKMITQLAREVREQKRAGRKLPYGQPQPGRAPKLPGFSGPPRASEENPSRRSPKPPRH